MTLSSLTLDYSGEPWYVTASGKALVFTLGTAVQMSGTIWYVKS